MNSAKGSPDGWRLRGHTRARGARSSSAAVPSKPRLKSASSTERPGHELLRPDLRVGLGREVLELELEPLLGEAGVVLVSVGAVA